MSSTGIVTHTQETKRALGSLFVDVSIDQAARKVVRAAMAWGGMVLVMCDAAGYCTAHLPGMPVTDRLVKISPWAVVGTYHVKANDPKAKETRDARALIAEDIQHHWQLLCEARAAA